MSNHAGFRSIPFLLFCLSAMALLSGAAFCADGKVNVTFSTNKYDIQRADQSQEISIEGYGCRLIPGMPAMPAQIFAIAVPPGAVVSDVIFDAGEGVELDGFFHVAPAGVPRAIGNENPETYAHDLARYEANFEAVYTRDARYPAQAGEVVRFAGYRKYNLVDVRIMPFAFYPESGRLVHHPNIKVEVRYSMTENAAPQKVWSDHLERTEKVAREIVINYDQAQPWYPQAENKSSRGLHDFVIITLPSLISAVQPLVTWENQKNRSVEVVTTDWISTNYPGYDLAERMRNFLRDKYPSGAWGIEDVLLVGHYDDVPMRRCWQDLGDGKPETDYYFAELSLPDSQSWDKDGDHKWGEDSDSVDFYTEVNVGRIPWSNATTVQKICAKSVSFEMNDDVSFKKNMLLLGAYFWPNTDNAVLMEYKSNPATHSWMADWTKTKMYESGHSTYPMDYNLKWSNVKDVWSAGKYSFVNWGGHGNPQGSYLYYSSGAFVDTSTCNSLNDDYPSIVFAAACSNSDTDSTNLGQCMLRQGAVGFVGATKVAYGSGGWSNPNHGSCQSFDYYFTTCVTSGDYTQGEAHQWALRKMYTSGHWYYNKYETFEWGALWGNPDLGYGTALIMYMNFPEGLPAAHCPPGTATEIIVELKDGLESFVPGTGYMHYRFSAADPYTAVGLTSLGNNLYSATLPVTRPGDEPQYYFSAQGNGGTTLYSPSGAPANAYSFDLYFEQVAWADDFETDTGWTVQNTAVDSGAWERGEPVFMFLQPGTDHSPNGTYCFVTGAQATSPDSNDLDGGPTRLTSPAIDLSDGDADISFYMWFYHSLAGTQEPLQIQISNNNGASWQPVLDVAPNVETVWDYYTFRVSDYVTPTSTVKMRFTVSDNPDDNIVEALLDDFVVTRQVANPTLWANAYSVDINVGADIDLTVEAGSGYANRTYLLLGSLSGTFPGFALPGGKVLPLNWDGLTDMLLAFLGTPVCLNFMGTLDGNGNASATLNTYGPLDPNLAGLMASFAYLLGPPPGFDFVSNPIVITFDL
ncbi:MAG: C25 family cysteine peptidase [Planctomycetota bacterium]